MTFAEFLEKCREVDGWAEDKLFGGQIRNGQAHCPLQAVFGEESGYRFRARDAGLNAAAIIGAADGYTNGPYRKALLGLVKP